MASSVRMLSWAVWKIQETSLWNSTRKLITTQEEIPPPSPIPHPHRQIEEKEKALPHPHRYKEGEEGYTFTTLYTTTTTPPTPTNLYTHMLRYLIASVDISSVFQTQQQDTWMGALLKLGGGLCCCNWQIHFLPQSTGIWAIMECVGRGIVCLRTDVWLNSILCDISLVERDTGNTLIL